MPSLGMARRTVAWAWSETGWLPGGKLEGVLLAIAGIAIPLVWERCWPYLFGAGGSSIVGPPQPDARGFDPSNPSVGAQIALGLAIFFGGGAFAWFVTFCANIARAPFAMLAKAELERDEAKRPPERDAIDRSLDALTRLHPKARPHLDYAQLLSHFAKRMAVGTSDGGLFTAIAELFHMERGPETDTDAKDILAQWMLHRVVTTEQRGGSMSHHTSFILSETGSEAVRRMQASEWKFIDKIKSQEARDAAKKAR